MGSDTQPFFVTTVCVRDDDARTFEFRKTGDSLEVVERISAALAKGRRVRCYTLGASKAAHEREERYLERKGYKKAAVDV